MIHSYQIQAIRKRKERKNEKREWKKSLSPQEYIRLRFPNIDRNYRNVVARGCPFHRSHVFNSGPRCCVWIKMIIDSTINCSHLKNWFTRKVDRNCNHMVEFGAVRVDFTWRIARAFLHLRNVQMKFVKHTNTARHFAQFNRWCLFVWTTRKM